MKKAAVADKSIVLDIVCAAFAENQSVNYVVKRDAKKLNRIAALVEYSYEMCLQSGCFAFVPASKVNDYQDCLA